MYILSGIGSNPVMFIEKCDSKTVITMLKKKFLPLIKLEKLLLIIITLSYLNIVVPNYNVKWNCSQKVQTQLDPNASYMLNKQLKQ